MKIAIGSDHHGPDISSKLIEFVRKLGHDPQAFGPEGTEPIDYPDIAFEVASKVSSGEFERAILICGTGVGMCITANKLPGVRAAPVFDELTAEISRRHNDLNVLCLSADMLSEKAVDGVVEAWLKTEFDGGRHARRVKKIAKLEEETAAQRETLTG